jgi:hypothetical protein
MTETRGGFGEHARHNEQRAGQAGGNAEGQSRRPHDYAGSAREQHNKRVLEDIRSQLQEEKAYHKYGGSRTAWLDSLSPAELKAHQLELHREWDRKVIRGGLSVAEFCARNPRFDPDLFTDDGRYLPGLPWGWARYELKKLVKFLHRLINPEDKKKKGEKPHLVIVQPPPDEPQEQPPPEQPDAPKEQATGAGQPQK